MVDDHDVGLERALAHARDPAGIEVGTGLADAVLAGGRDLAPEVGGVGQVLDLAAVAGARCAGAQSSTARKSGISSKRRKLPGLAEGPVAQRGRGSCPRPFMTATFRSRPSARARSGMSLGRSCSWRFLVPVETTTRRPSSTAGKEVGEGLAGAGAGLGEQQRRRRAASAPTASDEPRLRRPLLVVGQRAGQEAARAEERRRRQLALTLGHLSGCARRPEDVVAELRTAGLGVNRGPDVGGGSARSTRAREMRAKVGETARCRPGG